MRDGIQEAFMHNITVEFNSFIIYSLLIRLCHWLDPQLTCSCSLQCGSAADTHLEIWKHSAPPDSSSITWRRRGVGVLLLIRIRIRPAWRHGHRQDGREFGTKVRGGETTTLAGDPRRGCRSCSRRRVGAKWRINRGGIAAPSLRSVADICGMQADPAPSPSADNVRQVG